MKAVETWTIVLVLASVGSTFGAPARDGTARIRTVAWVSTTCRTDAVGIVGRQEIHVQRGDRPSVIVSQRAIEPVPDPLGLCRSFGMGANGTISVLAGTYPGLAVSPDGAHVVFELNDTFSLLDYARLGDDEKGFYMVRADGGDPVKLGPPTSVAVYRQAEDGTFDFGNRAIVFSPDGRYVVYSDLGPASDGTVDAQLWSLRLVDRKRTQLTHLARHSGGTIMLHYLFAFVDRTTIGFYTFDYYATGRRQSFYSVAVNGERFRELTPIIGENGRIVPRFASTRRRPAAQGLFVDGTPENPMLGIDRPRELFVATGENVLQLTRFNRVDIGNFPVVVSRDGERVFFTASADPVGRNPSNNCQAFSIDVLGKRLRQLTTFGQGERSEDGCFPGPAPGCFVKVLAQDPITGTLLIDSTCDPFATGIAGNQIFAMRPDGSGLRQITRARGMAIDTPDVVEVELPGPVAYQ